MRRLAADPVESRQAIRLSQPGREQEEPARGERESRGHPHQQAGELLILERREAGRMVREVRRVPDSRRDGQQRAQHAAVNGGDEHVDDGRAVAGAALAAVRDAPPEERGGAEEAQMLDDVHGLVLERRSRTAPARARSRARAP